MFTGIITHTVKVKAHTQVKDSLFLDITTPKGWKLKEGESVSTNGVCLTVKKINKGFYTVELMPETLAKTTFGKSVPTFVNLERALIYGGSVSGHFVTGHVDGVGIIEKIEKKGTSKVFFISFPKVFKKYLIEKGCITVDGTSLTIVNVTTNYFSVAVLPYTLKKTNFGEMKVGDIVNLEFDLIAKYVHNQ